MSAALYIHVPFCHQKCIYCDFYSITNLSRIEAFLSALEKEIELWSHDAFFQSRPFSTIYFGGGTPSLLSPESVSQILNKILRSFTFQKDVEISVEANPGTLSAQNLEGYLNAGVNRLTFGVQSFDNKDLKFLTRIHSAQEAESTLRLARATGFENIGIDLIFGIPAQTLLGWEKNLRRVITLRPEHISMYGLTYEANTPLWHKQMQGEIQKCDEELERQMFLRGIELFRDAGYEHYEISNFALPGRSSRHNQKYWDSSPFLGLGPSAHSFDGRKRWWNVADLEVYAKMLGDFSLPIDDEEILTWVNVLEEKILLGLRQKQGVNIREWAELLGRDLEYVIQAIVALFGGLDVGPPFQHSQKNFVLTYYKNQLCLTQQGLLLYNSVCEKLFHFIHKVKVDKVNSKWD